MNNLIIPTVTLWELPSLAKNENCLAVVRGAGCGGEIVMTEDWLNKAERQAVQELGDPPNDALSKTLPFTIVASIGGVIAVSIVGGDADFGGAWAGIIVGAVTFLYFSSQSRSYRKKYSEIIARYRPQDEKPSDEIAPRSSKDDHQLQPNKTEINDATPTEVIMQACAISQSLGATKAREAAEMIMGAPLTDEKWERLESRWDKVWDELLLNPGLAKRYTK